MTPKRKLLLFFLCCMALSTTELRAQDLTLTQIQVQASDPEALADWYIKYLGFKSKSVRKVAGTTYVSVDMGGLKILFVPSKDSKSSTLSFQSKDIKKLYDFLVASKVEISMPLNSLPMQPENEKNFSLKDPAGNYLSFHGTLK